MYNHHPPNSTTLQDLALAFTSETQLNTNHTNEAMPQIDLDSDETIDPLLTDPLTERIFNVALELLQSNSQVTIYDVAESCHLSDFPVRQRLNALVQAGKLRCLPGSGRRAAQYFLPRTSMFTFGQNQQLEDDTASASVYTEALAVETAEDIESKDGDTDTFKYLNSMLNKINQKYEQNQQHVAHLQAIGESLLKDKEALLRTIELLSNEQSNFQES